MVIDRYCVICTSLNHFLATVVIANAWTDSLFSRPLSSCSLFPAPWQPRFFPWRWGSAFSFRGMAQHYLCILASRNRRLRGNTHAFPPTRYFDQSSSEGISWILRFYQYQRTNIDKCLFCAAQGVHYTRNKYHSFPQPFTKDIHLISFIRDDGKF